MSGITSLGFRKISADKVSTSFRVREKKDKENSGEKKKKTRALRMEDKYEEYMQRDTN